MRPAGDFSVEQTAGKGRAEVQELYDRIAIGYFTVATWFLGLLAILLLFGAVWEVAAALVHGEILGVLESVGLVIIGFAIIETAKFIAEEPFGDNSRFWIYAEDEAGFAEVSTVQRAFEQRKLFSVA